MAQYALDRVLSIAGSYAATNSQKGITAGDVAMLIDQVSDPSLSFTNDTEDIVDARNNVVMVLENGRGATFGASNAFFNTQLLAAQTGGKIETVGSGGVSFTKYDILTLDAEKKGTLTANTTATTAKMYKLENDNSLITASAINGSIATGKVSESTTEGSTAVLAAGDRVLVVYTATLTEGEKITALANGTNELMNVTAEVLLRDLCDESLVYAYLIMKGKLSGETEWGMTRDGKHAFELRCMPSYCEDPRKLVEIIIIKGEDLLEA